MARPDIIIGGRWYENPGDVLKGEWKEHLYMDPRHFDTAWTNGDIVVQVGDINRDGGPDIVLSPSEGTGRLSWFEAPPDPRTPDWNNNSPHERRFRAVEQRAERQAIARRCLRGTGVEMSVHRRKDAPDVLSSNHLHIYLKQELSRFYRTDIA